MALFTDLGNGFAEYIEDNSLYSTSSISSISRDTSTITIEFMDESILSIAESVWSQHHATVELAIDELFTVFQYSGQSGGTTTIEGSKVCFARYRDLDYPTSGNALNVSGGTYTVGVNVTKNLELIHKNTTDVFSDGTKFTIVEGNLYELEMECEGTFFSSNTTIELVIRVNGTNIILSRAVITSISTMTQTVKCRFSFSGTTEAFNNGIIVRLLKSESGGGCKLYNIRFVIKDFGAKIV